MKIFFFLLFNFESYMDTQNKEETQIVDPKTEDTNEKTSDQIDDETTTDKEIVDSSDEWEEKFKKQSSNAQRAITKANEKLYTVHLKLAEIDLTEQCNIQHR
jgi:hypothetical protein